MNTSLPIALANEVRKGLRFAWSERLQILIELPMFAAFILLLEQGRAVVPGGVAWPLGSELTSVMVVWFVPFIFFYMQAGYSKRSSDYGASGPARAIVEVNSLPT